jgi:polar amino acid transport system substrate-binding protein
MAQLYIDANPDANLMVVENFEFYMDESTSGTRIGMPKGEDELTDEINRIIDEVIESGEFDQWHKEFTEYAKSLGL